MTDDYHILGYEGELEVKVTNNLFDAVDIIKRLRKAGKKVVVASNITESDDFINRVRRIYR